VYKARRDDIPGHIIRSHDIQCVLKNSIGELDYLLPRLKAYDYYL